MCTSRSTWARFTGFVIVVLVVLATLLATIGSAHAHEPGFSSVRVVVLDDTIEVNLSVPLDLLGESAELALTDNPEEAVEEHRHDLAAYLGRSVEIRSVEIRSVESRSDEVVWESSIDQLDVTVLVDDDHVDAVMTFVSPDGIVDDFDLHYEVIIDRDDDHEVIVGVVDPAQDTLSGGTLRSGRTILSVSSGGAAVQSSTSAFFDIVGLGFDHVLEGADHILFLIVLVLPAPLMITAQRRWDGRASTRRMIGHVVGVSTSFLVGHSATLTLASLGWVSAPPGPVEVLIAGSIAVGAIHAMRPLVPRGEMLIAGVFGLVHGLAFAEILESLALDKSSQLLNLLAFNLGVELAQLTAIAFFLPALHLLSRTAHYRKVRLTGALLSLAAAIGWMGDRTGVFSNPLAPVEDAAIERSLLIVVTLTVLAVGMWVRAWMSEESLRS